MRIALMVVMVLLSIAGFGFGSLCFKFATSAVHEIEALIGFLIGVCALGFVGVMASLETKGRPVLLTRAQRPE